jgi:hypothetical protein
MFVDAEEFALLLWIRGAVLGVLFQAVRTHGCVLRAYRESEATYSQRAAERDTNTDVRIVGSFSAMAF